MAPRTDSAASSPLAAATKRSSDAVEHWFPKDVPNREVPTPGQTWRGWLGPNHQGKPLLARLNWLHVPLLVSTPLLALYGLATSPLDWRTYAFAVFWYAVTGLGITAGYHRLFAHRAYKATTAARVLLMLMGSGAVEGSVRWWSRDHRAHHKFVDTEKDPYAIIYGFFYAHIGWMLVKQDKEKIGRADIKDLDADPILRFQHKWYLPIAVLTAFVIPTLVCGLGWGDYWGGYFIAGVARLVFVHHSTFCVNSLAHWVGDATYTDGHTARNSIFTAFCTLGEGYHNFHHEFPSDYRNAIEWYQYDPTKVFIWCLSNLGLVYDLQMFPANEVVKGQLQMEQKALDAKKTRVNWGPNPATLPEMSDADFKKAVAGGKKWLIVNGFVLDVAAFAPSHPGGENLVRAYIGKDATAEFKGEVYRHSVAATNLSDTLRVARLKGYWAQ